MTARAQTTIAVEPPQRGDTFDRSLSPDQPHRDFLLAALRDGASLVEILVMILTWRKLTPLEIGDQLSLPLHRVQDLIDSIRNRWGAASARQANEKRIAADDRRQVDRGWMKFHCPQCRGEFNLLLLDPRLCPQCLAPLRQMLTHRQKLQRQQASRQRRELSKGAA